MPSALPFYNPTYLAGLSYKPNFFLVISHAHDDHIDDYFLNKYFNKDMKIIINKFPSPSLAKRVKQMGFENVILKYSDRPDLRVGSDAVWDKSEKALLKAVKETKLDYSINKGEGAFYGPKIEFVLRDAIGRDWQCGTLQVDLNLPERLGASYVEKDGSKKVPVMLHRALFGSLERFIGILIENYSGKLPFWISPLQIVVIPVSDEFDEYSKKVNKQLIDAGFSSEVDLKNHNLNYKIRDHSLSKVPILLICGKKEVDSNSVTIRRLDSNEQENIELNKFITTHQALNKAPSL